MFIAALTLLSAVGLLTWAWFAVTRVEQGLRDLGSFDGWHFEVGSDAPKEGDVTSMV